MLNRVHGLSKGSFTSAASEISGAMQAQMCAYFSAFLQLIADEPGGPQLAALLERFPKPSLLGWSKPIAYTSYLVSVRGFK